MPCHGMDRATEISGWRETARRSGAKVRPKEPTLVTRRVRAAATCDGPSSAYDELPQTATRHRTRTTSRRNLRRDIVHVRRAVATCDETSFTYDEPSQLATRHRTRTTSRRNLRRAVVHVRRLGLQAPGKAGGELAAAEVDLAEALEVVR